MKRLVNGIIYYFNSPWYPKLVFTYYIATNCYTSVNDTMRRISSTHMLIRIHLIDNTDSKYTILDRLRVGAEELLLYPRTRRPRPLNVRENVRDMSFYHSVIIFLALNVVNHIYKVPYNKNSQHLVTDVPLVLTVAKFLWKGSMDFNAMSASFCCVVFLSNRGTEITQNALLRCRYTNLTSAYFLYIWFLK